MSAGQEEGEEQAKGETIELSVAGEGGQRKRNASSPLRKGSRAGLSPKQCLLWVWYQRIDLVWSRRGGPDAAAQSNFCGAVKPALGSEEAESLPGPHTYWDCPSVGLSCLLCQVSNLNEVIAL